MTRATDSFPWLKMADQPVCCPARVELARADALTCSDIYMQRVQTQTETQRDTQKETQAETQTDMQTHGPLVLPEQEPSMYS